MKLKEIIFYPLFILILGTSCTQKPSTELTIATASNMQYAIREVAKAFENEISTSVNIITASSGKITAQITEGAPYDVFVSADMKYTERLEKAGMTASEPRIYAIGQLVLWSSSHHNPPSLELLRDQKIRHIAIANPKTAPYGEAAMQVLENIGIYNEVRDKLIYGESVAQTNQFIISGAAEVGFTAKSTIISNNSIKRTHWTDIDSSLYKPISQSVVSLQNGNVGKAEDFINFLMSDQGNLILEKYGYILPLQK